MLETKEEKQPLNKDTSLVRNSEFRFVPSSLITFDISEELLAAARSEVHQPALNSSNKCRRNENVSMSLWTKGLYL